MDYLYENGQIVESRKPVAIDWGEIGQARTYGLLQTSGTGGATIDPTGDIVYGYALGGVGGKLLGLGLKGFVRYTGFPKQWFRLGSSYSHSLESKTYLSLRWGAGGNHW